MKEPSNIAYLEGMLNLDSSDVEVNRLALRAFEATGQTKSSATIFFLTNQYRRFLCPWGSEEHSFQKKYVENTLKKLVDLYAGLSENEQVKLLEQVIKESDAVLLQALHAYEIQIGKEDQFQAKLDKLEIEDLDKLQLKQYASFLLNLTEEQQWLISDLMAESSVLGNITYQGGLLVCSQIAARKLDFFDYNPTVLQPTEFSEYLKILKNNLKNLTPPHQERFVITGNHWISGNINIDVNGEVSILFMDSLGYKSTRVLPTYVQQFADIFEKSTIYAPDFRQVDEESCMVFSLYDARHLYTIDKYLSEIGFGGGLHDYLAKSAEKLAEKKLSKGEAPQYGLITPCELPLPFMRAMQSRQLSKIVEERSEAERDVLGYQPEDIKKFFVETKEGSPERNVRIKQTLDKIAGFNSEFIKENIMDREKGVEAIKEDMKPFTLEGFQKRMVQMQALKEERKNETPTSSTTDIGNLLSIQVEDMKPLTKDTLHESQQVIKQNPTNDSSILHDKRIENRINEYNEEKEIKSSHNPVHRK